MEFMKSNADRKYNYEFLEFLDSPDIREYNKNTRFHPAEQAVLVARSQKRTLEEKIKALQYLADLYSEEDFQNGSAMVGGYNEKSDGKFRECVLETVRVWNQILNDRYNQEGYVYAAALNEKDYINYEISEYSFFSDYENACQSLSRQKDEYLKDDDLKDTQTIGRILRLKLDDLYGHYTPYDEYYFDHEMKLINVWRSSPECCYKSVEEYSVFVPLPFEPGDLVKVTSPFWPTYYGVISHKWERRKPEFQGMLMSIDVYDDRSHRFDYTDDTDILSLEYCLEEELSASQKILKQISDVRRGKMDFYRILNDMEYGFSQIDKK